MAKDWKHISTAPRDRPFLVCGGTWEGEINSPEPVTSATKVIQERPGKFDVCDTDAYASWVNDPTHWCDLPEILKPATQEFDL